MLFIDEEDLAKGLEPSCRRWDIANEVEKIDIPLGVPVCSELLHFRAITHNELTPVVYADYPVVVVCWEGGAPVMVLQNESPIPEGEGGENRAHIGIDRFVGVAGISIGPLRAAIDSMDQEVTDAMRKNSSDSWLDGSVRYMAYEIAHLIWTFLKTDEMVRWWNRGDGPEIMVLAKDHTDLRRAAWMTATKLGKGWPDGYDDRGGRGGVLRTKFISVCERSPIMDEDELFIMGRPKAVGEGVVLKGFQHRARANYMEVENDQLWEAEVGMTLRRGTFLRIIRG